MARAHHAVTGLALVGLPVEGPADPKIGRAAEKEGKPCPSSPKEK